MPAKSPYRARLPHPKVARLKNLLSIRQAARKIKCAHSTVFLCEKRGMWPNDHYLRLRMMAAYGYGPKP